MQKSLKILMPNDVTRSTEPFAMSVYGVLQIIYRSDLGVTNIPLDLVAYHLGYKLPLEHRTKSKIIDALECLDELGYIKKSDEQYLVDTSSIYTTSGYEFCSVEIFRKLMDRPDLLKHYLTIKRGLIDGKCKYSIPYFAKAEETSTRTINRRNKELEDMHLIIIYQDTYKNGRNNNVYTLYSEEQAEKKRTNYSDLNRSVSARYNAFVKNPAKFTPLQKKTLRQEVIEYNERNPARAKDLSVFN